MPNAKQLFYQTEKTAKVFYKKAVLKNFALFTGKHLWKHSKTPTWWWWIVFVVWLTDERRTLVSSQDHCQRSSPSRISDTPQAGFEPAQNLSSDFDEWSCAVVITTTSKSICVRLLLNWLYELNVWNIVSGGFQTKALNKIWCKCRLYIKPLHVLVNVSFICLSLTVNTLFYCDRQNFNLTGGFFIFLFMVTGREIFICSAALQKFPQYFFGILDGAIFRGTSGRSPLKRVLKIYLFRISVTLYGLLF